MLELTPAQRRTLKSLAHHLPPVVLIGDAGLTPAVLREIDVHLSSHELIKVRVAGDDRAARDAIMTGICEAHGAAPVQQIGKMLVIYRPKPDEAEAPEKAKASPAARPTRRPASRKKARAPLARKPTIHKPAGQPATRKAVRKTHRTKRSFQR